MKTARRAWAVRAGSMLQRRVLLIFVDGLGLGADEPQTNPVVSGCCPHLERLLREAAVAADARLDTPGLPQSATGQAALLTGINAARAVGRHVEGFPGPDLRRIIEPNSIFRRLGARGLPSTFANAYFVGDVEAVRRSRLQSVTTVAALSAFGTVRDAASLARNEAVYHDLTRASLAPRGYRGPLVTPEQAAEHLLAIARRHAFTLFEYFLTDRAGHRRDAALARQILSSLDVFIGRLLGGPAERDLLVALTSDHGNIEDLSVETHTLNPVPFAAVGEGSGPLRRRVRSLPDVAPALLDWLAALDTRQAVSDTPRS